MENSVIKVENVSKLYKLYDRPSDRVKEALGVTRKRLYREHYALSDISFEINKGESVGIIGANGAGKSTILKIVTGVINQSDGTVQINGRISALLELGAGFNMEYTGLENVYINGRMNGFSKSEIDDKLSDILEFADIGNFINQPVKTYSSGMFVRLAFAVAINIDPEILIVDEALSVGDIFFQAKCFRKFEEFKKNGKTILFVSHSMGSIQKYCDRAILLNRGKLIVDTSPKEAIDLYNKIMVDNDQVLATDTDNNTTKEAVKENENVLWKEKLYTNTNAIEYGNKAALIKDFCVLDCRGQITNTISKGEEFAIKMKIRFCQRIYAPILAYTIKDIKGVELTGANTLLNDKDIDLVQAGEEITITFTQTMNLRSNEYLLALGCTGYMDGEFVIYHRLYDVCNIQVIADKDSVGLFDMNSRINIEKNG